MDYGSVNYVFGAPGCGKTTYLAKLNRYFLRRGIKTFANFDLKGAIRIHDEDLGYYHFGGVLLLDEAGISYNNRDFKNGLFSDKKRLRYWKLVRHYGDTIFLASQGWNDVDKKARDLCDHYFMIHKWLFGLTFVKPVYRTVDIDPLTHEPTDYFEFDGFFHWSPVWRRRYYKDFDSFACPALPEFPANKYLLTPVSK